MILTYIYNAVQMLSKIENEEMVLVCASTVSLYYCTRLAIIADSQ